MLSPSFPAWADRGDDDYAVAARHYEKGRWQAAIQEFQAFLIQHPQHPGHDEAQFLLGEAQVQLGRYAEAQATLRAFVTQHPNHTYAKLARFRLGESAFLAGDHPVATEALQQFQDAFPQDALLAYVLPYLAEIALTAGEVDRAEKLYMRALREFPQTPYQRECRFGLAQALEQQGKSDDALRFYRYLAQSSDPLGQAARLRGAMLLYARADFDAALQLLSPFDRVLTTSKLRTEARYWTARCYMAKQEWIQADIALEKALESPADTKLLDTLTFFRGEVHRRGGKAANAVTFYEQVITQWPTSPWADDAVHGLIQLAFEKEDYARVVELAQRFSQEHTASELLIDVWRWEGRAQLKRQEFTLAAAAFERLIEFRKTQPVSTHVADARNVADAQVANGAAEHPANPTVKPTVGGAIGRATDNNRLPTEQDDPSTNESPTIAGNGRSPELAIMPRSTATPTGSTDNNTPDTSTAPTQATDNLASGTVAGKEGQSDINLAGDRYYLSLAYLGLGRTHEALHTLSTIPIEDSSSTLTRGVLAAQGNALIEQKRYAEAIEPFRRLVAWAPNSAETQTASAATSKPSEPSSQTGNSSTSTGSSTTTSTPATVLTPERADAQAKLVVALVETGRREEACQLVMQWRERYASHPLLDSTTLYAADRAAAGGLDPAARSLYQQLADRGLSREQQVVGWLGLGRLAVRGHDYETAVTAFGRAQESSTDRPEAAEASLQQALAWEQLGKTVLARRAFARTYVHHAQATQGPDALLAAARFEQKLSEHEAAMVLLQQLCEEFPDYAQRDAALYELAWSAQTQQVATVTRQAYESLVTTYPQSRYRADSLFRLAEAAAEQGETEQAGRWLDELLNDTHLARTNEPLRCHAIYLRGKLAADAKQWPKVIELMQTLLREFPTHELHEVAEYWLAEAHFKLEQWTEAEPLFASLQARQGERREIWRGMVMLRLAQITARKKDWTTAHELAQSLAENFPQFPQSQEVDYLLGRCLSSQGRFREARDHFQQVIDSPSAAQTELAAIAQWMIGESFLHQKNYAEAIRAYHRVETLHAYPRWQAAALFQAAKCHELLQQPAAARELYDQLLKDYPQSPYVDEAKTRREILGASE